MIKNLTVSTFQNKLPDYVIWQADEASNNMLRTKAALITFPMSAEDKNDLSLLEQKFDNENGCAGLAATQIGISKRFIVFAVPDSPKVIKSRSDFDISQVMPKTLWINPSYVPLTKEKREDIEGCFSVPDVVGMVERFTEIKYEAYDASGILITGIAEGFLARVIQHEIDHLDGKLFIDLVPKDKFFSKEEYMSKYRNENVEKNEV